MQYKIAIQLHYSTDIRNENTLYTIKTKDNITLEEITLQLKELHEKLTNQWLNGKGIYFTNGLEAETLLRELKKNNNKILNFEPIYPDCEVFLKY